MSDVRPEASPEHQSASLESACHPDVFLAGLQRPEVAEHVASPPDGYLTVFDAYQTPAEADPVQAGQQARQLIDAELPDTGILLIRHTGLSNAEACSKFAQGLGYERMTYEPYGSPRKKVSCN